MTDFEKFSHPVFSNYETRLLPHIRVYNKLDGSYLSPKNETIKLTVKSTKRYDLLTFIYECKENKTLEKGKVVTLIDENEPISFNNIQVVDEEKEEVREVIAVNTQSSVETKYPSIKEAKKATGVRIALIKYCCQGLADKVKNENNGWYSFRFS
jgi:hypothetical protein